MAKMDVSQWQKRLEENFTINGHVGGNLFEVFESERACGDHFIRSFYGQSVLIDSFQHFFIATLKDARKWVIANGWPKNCPSYGAIYVYYLVMFRRFRACETLLLKGYPFDGYALLRGLKEQAILLAGIVHNLTTLTAVFGAEDVQGLTEDDFKRITKLRKKEEGRVFGILLRKDSGLPQETIKELGIWERMFHEEVHGSKFSFGAELLKWSRGKGEPSIGPTLDETSWSNYMNRAVEIGWLIVRLFPYLQPTENAFGEGWHRKHEILDDSFRCAEQSLSENCKEIGEAIMKLVDEKFSFKKPFHYLESDGSGPPNQNWSNRAFPRS